jgi:hypothetical protein
MFLSLHYSSRSGGVIYTEISITVSHLAITDEF